MLPHATVLAAAVLAVTCVTAPARAQAALVSTPSPAAASSPPEPTIDTRPGIAAVAAIGGAVMGIAGAVLLATAPPRVPRAQDPCCTGDSPIVPISGRRFGGAGLLGGGLAFTAIGVPLYLATSGGPARSHRSESQMTAGVALTTIGLGLVGAGTGVVLGGMTVGDSQNPFLGVLVGGPMLLVGALTTSIGIPLWVSGASPPDVSARRPPPVTSPELSIGARSLALRFQF